jgi:prepilin-type N-terminal cleavage/methylation domain-containing protein
MNRTGFTLIELLVIMAIIAVITAIVMPVLGIHGGQNINESNIVCDFKYSKVTKFYPYTDFMALFKKNNETILLECEEEDWARLIVGKTYSISHNKQFLLDWSRED